MLTPVASSIHPSVHPSQAGVGQSSESPAKQADRERFSSDDPSPAPYAIYPSSLPLSTIQESRQHSLAKPRITRSRHPLRRYVGFVKDVSCSTAISFLLLKRQEVGSRKPRWMERKSNHQYLAGGRSSYPP